MNYYESTEVRREQVKDWLREAEHDRLVRQVLKAQATGAKRGTGTLGWSGISFVVAGLLILIASFLPSRTPVTAAALASRGWVVAHIVLMAALLLSLWGLVGLHIHHREQAGRAVLFGFALALCGTVLLAGSIFADAFFLPLIATGGPEMPESAGLLSASIFSPPLLAVATASGFGCLLIALAAFRAGRLPLHAGLILSVGAQATILLRLLAPASAITGIGVSAFGVGYLALGYVLLKRSGQASLQPQSQGG